jgi:hypothetical protein
MHLTFSPIGHRNIPIAPLLGTSGDVPINGAVLGLSQLNPVDISCIKPLSRRIAHSQPSSNPSSALRASGWLAGSPLFLALRRLPVPSRSPRLCRRSRALAPLSPHLHIEREGPQQGNGTKAGDSAGGSGRRARGRGRPGPASQPAEAGGRGGVTERGHALYM